jgi:hypothetical protein
MQLHIHCHNTTHTDYANIKTRFFRNNKSEIPLTNNWPKGDRQQLHLKSQIHIQLPMDGMGLGTLSTYSVATKGQCVQ